MSPIRQLIALAIARDLSAIVVPGVEVARALGLDIEAAGIRIAATPRHAGILIIAGAIPSDLHDSVAVIYAQMVRPRVILSLGGVDISTMPPADISVGLSQQALLAGIRRLRAVLAESAFCPEIQAFDSPVLRSEIVYSCPMHPEVIQDNPGSCPKCGMALVQRNAQDKPGAHHKETSSSPVVAEDIEHGDPPQAHSKSEPEHKSAHGMAFMSMIEVTKDLSASADGLRMDWNDVPFGPFFPGLPGGLLLTMTLDGDNVATLSVRTLVGNLGLLQPVPETADTFIERLSGINPLTPTAYRLLACRALEQAGGRVLDSATARKRVGALERERITSHLGWLAQFGLQIGFDWLTLRASALQLRFLHATLHDMQTLSSDLHTFIKRLLRTPLLKIRLNGLGQLARLTSLRGPVARATGIQNDARMLDPIYSSLGFRPILRANGDAFERFCVRTMEMAQSLELIKAAEAMDIATPTDFGNISGEGHAMVETPRGFTRLGLTLEYGHVVAAQLDTPSTHYLTLLPSMTTQQELGDALVTIGSMDISPWEVTQ